MLLNNNILLIKRKMNSFKQNSTQLFNNSKSMIQFRKLKILTKYRTRKYDETKIPEIRLEGNGLKHLVLSKVRPLRLNSKKIS